MVQNAGNACVCLLLSPVHPARHSERARIFCSSGCLELLDGLILKEDIPCSLCEKLKYVGFLRHFARFFPIFLLILTCFLHVFKEEDPGKTYLILREKLIRVDDA